MKTIVESICALMNNASLSDLQLIMKMAEARMKESVGFDVNVEMPF